MRKRGRKRNRERKRDKEGENKQTKQKRTKTRWMRGQKKGWGREEEKESRRRRGGEIGGGRIPNMIDGRGETNNRSPRWMDGYWGGWGGWGGWRGKMNSVALRWVFPSASSGNWKPRRPEELLVTLRLRLPGRGWGDRGLERWRKGDGGVGNDGAYW